MKKNNQLRELFERVKKTVLLFPLLQKTYATYFPINKPVLVQCSLFPVPSFLFPHSSSRLFPHNPKKEVDVLVCCCSCDLTDCMMIPTTTECKNNPLSYSSNNDKIANEEDNVFLLIWHKSKFWCHWYDQGLMSTTTTTTTTTIIITSVHHVTSCCGS